MQVMRWGGRIKCCKRHASIKTSDRTSSVKPDAMRMSSFEALNLKHSHV